MTKLTLGSLTKAVAGTKEEAPIRVLHVDDEPGFLKVAKRCLELEGAFQVENALSAEEAAEKMKDKKFDVIISDYVMPGKDGLEFLKELREKGDNTPFIMLTGKGREEVAVRALKLGADQYINKVGEPETVYGELAHGIRQALKTRQAEVTQKQIDWGSRSLVELAPESIVTLDTKGTITSCNHGLREKLGYSKGEIVGKHWSKLGFFRARDLPKFAKIFSSILRGKANELHEINCVCKDGTKLALEAHISLLKDKGKTVGLVIVSNDITERNKTEEELIRQSGFLKTLRDGIAVSDANANIIEVNDAILKMYGTDKKEDLIGKNSFDIIAPEDRKKAFAGLKEVLKKGYNKGIKYRIITKDGSKIYVEMSSSAMKGKDGKILGFVGIVRDVTERNKAEEILKESEEKYRKLFDESLDAIFIADAESGIIFDCNRAASELVGREKSELIGKHQRILHPPHKIKGGFSRTFKQHLKEKEGQVLETQVITKKGEIKDVAIKANVFELGGKKLIQGTFRDITERKKSEEELRSSREQLNILFQSSPDAYYLSDLKGKFVDGNKAAEELIGYDKSELIGKSFLKLKLLSRRDILKATKLLAKNALGKSTGPDEFVLNRKDGTQVWIEINTVPVKIKKQNLVLGVARDITERKEAEEKLAQERDLLYALMDNIPDTVYFKDVNSRFTRTNKAHAQVLGLKDPKEVVGKTDFDFFSGEHAKAAYKDEQRIVKTGKPLISKEEKAKRADGTFRWVSSTKVPIKDKEGKVIGIVGISRDITERKEAEEALAQERDLLRALMDNIPDTVYFKDVNSRFTRTNKAHAQVLGLKDPKEVVGKTDLDFFSGEHAKAAYKDEQRIVKTGKPLISKEEKAKRADGTFRWVSSTKVPIKDKEGKVIGIVGISRNITGRKDAEEKLNETLKNLKLLNEKLRVVGKLTRHDVRNKLSAVAGNVFLVKRRLTGDSEVLEYLEDVESACQQVGEIFDFSRTYEMLGVEKLVYMDVEKSLGEAVSLFSSLHGVKLMNDCRGLTVLADSLLRQILYNLIDNSLKYGEKISRIRVHYEETGKDKLKLVYEDDGVGIPKDEKEKIFEEGYGKGTGYGLYLIKRICEVYGWTIRETGKQSKGVQFIMTIPKIDESGRERYRLTSPVVKAKVKDRHSLSMPTVPRARH